MLAIMNDASKIGDLNIQGGINEMLQEMRQRRYTRYLENHILWVTRGIHKTDMREKHVLIQLLQ